MKVDEQRNLGRKWEEKKARETGEKKTNKRKECHKGQHGKNYQGERASAQKLRQDYEFKASGLHGKILSQKVGVRLGNEEKKL